MSTFKTVPDNYAHRTRAINWNAVNDPMDITVWNRANANVWWPERIPISDDIPASRLLTAKERLALTRVLTGLTFLDTMQAEKGLPSMQDDIANDRSRQHELHVYKQFDFMECFTADHELLTPDGWVPISRIKVGDTVLQYDPLTLKATFETVVMSSSHTPDRTLSLMLDDDKEYLRVSPGHRLYLEKQLGHDLAPLELTAQEFIDTPNKDQLWFKLLDLIHKDDGTVIDRPKLVNASTVKVNEAKAEPVYGIQVPSTFLVVKHDDVITISGNCVHAKSYSSIFSTLLSTQEIDAAFLWSEQNVHLQRKGYLITEKYVGNCPFERRQSSVWLESFMFYSGFFYPLLLNDTHKLSNTGDVIKLIAR